LLVTEGESDAAAGLDLGCWSVSRSGCTSCVSRVIDLIHRVKPERIVVVADRDTPGHTGGHALCTAINGAGYAVRLLTLPDAKDLREWKSIYGSMHHDLASLINNKHHTKNGLVGMHGPAGYQTHR